MVKPFEEEDGPIDDSIARAFRNGKYSILIGWNFPPIKNFLDINKCQFSKNENGEWIIPIWEGNDFDIFSTNQKPGFLHRAFDQSEARISESGFWPIRAQNFKID